MEKINTKMITLKPLQHVNAPPELNKIKNNMIAQRGCEFDDINGLSNDARECIACC